ncbi:ArsR/SmtB family transcription factor [Nonomuraea polychroma]|uniref:ArsR/SmtB family transcription factor n=1 Tax=Nonomuraea polychroma TaxID=46176 RepID=UPI003D8DC623
MPDSTAADVTADTAPPGQDTHVQQCSAAADEADRSAADLAVAELSPAAGAFLRALASPVRQRILLLFARGAELSVGQVAERAGIGQPRASEQLAELKRGGVLTSRKAGKVTWYRADRQAAAAALADLQAYLKHCC